MDKLISVVIPIYNVEKYLKKCVDSIINQTYKNIEIILVDDGSPDSCPEICDEYQKKDSRIIVYHKNNGGLSDARNFGIEKSKADYIIFIDSDDYIEKDMVETLFNNIIKFNADISMCNFVEEDDNGNILKKVDYTNTIYSYSTNEALYELVSQKKITNHAWNKLYKKSLFKSVRYPVNQLMEDINTTYKLFEKSNKIVFEDKPLYHYIQRGNSILGNVTEKRILDQDKAVKERNSYLYEKYTFLKDIILIDNLENLKTIYRLSYIMNYKEIYGATVYKNEYKYNKKIYKKIKKNARFSFSTKIFYFSKLLYKIFVLLKKVIKHV